MSAPTLTRDALFKKLRSKPENKVCVPLCSFCCVWERRTSDAASSRQAGKCNQSSKNSGCHRLYCVFQKRQSLMLVVESGSLNGSISVWWTIRLITTCAMLDDPILRWHAQEHGTLCRFALIVRTRILLGLQCPTACTSAWRAPVCIDRLGCTSHSSALPI